MFVTMKKLLCLLTVLLMCTVSFGANTEAVKKQKTKVIVLAGQDFEKFAQSFSLLTERFIYFTDQLKHLEKDWVEVNLNFKAEKPFSNYDFMPIKEDEKPKTFYKDNRDSINTKPISNKAKHFRKSRDAI